ncbi:hypothetical protein B0O80DRAFT_492748 [Mortierella sp. GBAus27b]|nr:hypothetical protein BGX31_007538 [Mortierella sp. GBA43]KAI8363622.1 hypothetical protein B0O80DRAFT_492748 [Mortierella sp. GBAus27b]
MASRVVDSFHRKLSKITSRRSSENPGRNGNAQDTGFVSTHTSVGTDPYNNWDLTIVFQGAKDLPRGDLLSSDPFLEAYLGPKDKGSLSFVTGVQWATLNPQWDATWQLVNVPDGMMLQILVKDKNKMMVDTDLGRASLILGSELEGKKDHVIDVWQSDDRKYGKLFIQTIGKRTKSIGLTKASTAGPARYSRHTSYAAGVLTRDTREKKHEFYTYRVRLYHLYDVFGTDSRFYQHWNTNYDAAKRIFADSLEGLNVRNALHSQHSYLYRHGRNTVYGALGTGEDWGQLLHGDRLDKDVDLRTIVFTYSIVPKGLYFSETGAAFFQDFMSKHAMHANRAQEVMYAGEFRLFKDNNGVWTLLIDNNSGTYAPKKEEIDKLKEVFERNFSGLAVIAVDREDPYLKQISDATREAEISQTTDNNQRLLLFDGLRSKSEVDTLRVHREPNHVCDVESSQL